MNFQEYKQQMIDGGAPRGEVEAFEQRSRTQMIQGGAPPADVSEFFGDPKPADTKPIADVVTSNLDLLDEEQRTKTAESWPEMFSAGLQESSGGLMTGKPNLQAPIDMTLAQKTLHATGMMIGDLPASIVGLGMGVAAGGAAAGPPGAIIGAGAGGLALPTAIREVLMGYYDNPDGPKTWGEFAEEFARVQWEVATAAVVGGTSAAGGQVVGGAMQAGTRVMLGETGAKLVGGVANATTFATTTALMDAGFRGNIPTAEDFLVAAVLAVGFTAAGSLVGQAKRFVPNARTQDVAANLRDIYAETGINPKDIINKARSDVVLQGEILAPRDAAGNKVTPTLDGLKPKEPVPKNPYKPEINGKTIEKLTEPPPETAPPAEKQAVTDYNTQLDTWVEGMRRLENTEGYAKAHGMEVKDVVSSAGAIGEMQIMPGTARQYGYDPARLFEPEYNRMVGRTIIADLAKRFNGDFEAMAVGYNAGPGRAKQWLAAGRDISVLKPETIGYLRRAEAMGLSDGTINWEIVNRQYAASNHGETPSNNFRPDTKSYDYLITSEHRVVRVGPDIDGFRPAPEAVASYMQKFGQLADFTFMVGPASEAQFGANSPRVEFFAKKGYDRNDPTAVMKHVYIPDTPAELTRRWYGLGPSEILFHEAGHAIDTHLNGGKPTKPTAKFSPELTKEMAGASRQFRPDFWNPKREFSQIPHVIKASELIADAIAVWISNPSYRKSMPKFGEIYAELLEPYIKAAEAALPKRVKGGWEPPPGAGDGPRVEPPIGNGGGGKNPGGGGGGDWVPPSQGLPKPDPEKPRKVTSDFPALNEEQMVARVLDIVAPPSGMRAPDYLNPAKIIAEFDMALAPARQIDKILNAPEGFYGIEDIMRNTLASRERAGYFVRYGVLDAITLSRTGDASFVAAFKAVKEDGGTQEGFEAYRLAKRALELEGRDIVSGVDLEVARRYTTMSKVKAKYERGAKIIREVKDASIDYAVDSGRFSPKLAAAMKALNQHHIVLRRLMEDDYNPPRTGAFFGGRRAAPRKIKGSNLQVVDTLTADIDNLHTIISIADHNRAVGAVIAAIEAHNAKLNDPTSTRRIPFERIGERMIEDKTITPTEFFDAQGNKIELPPEVKTAAEVFLATRRSPGFLGPDDFVYYREGRMEIWRAKDPALAKLMRQTWPGQVNLFAQAAIQVAGLVRAGVTAAFDFPVRTTMLAQLSASVLAKGGHPLPFKDMVGGVVHVFKGDEIYKDWIAKGGAGTAITDMDVNYVRRDVGRIFEETGTVNRVWNTVAHPIEAMRTLNHMVDAAARVGMKQRLEKQGVDPRKAAMMARKGYIDFAEPFANQWVQMWSRMAAFMSASWKDIEQFGQRIKENPGRVTMIGATVLVTPTIVNYALNMVADQYLPDGQKYQDLPRWMRDQYWVFPPVNGVRLKLKRPWLPAVPFALFPERFMDWAATNEPHFNDWITSILAMSMPPFMPNVFVPSVEDWGNRSLTTGRPLIPAHLEDATGYMQYTPDTSALSKKLTEVLGPASLNLMDASPIVVDNYIRQWTGTLPMTIAKVLERPFVTSERPRQWADVPFLGSFFARNVPGGQSVDDFYDRLDEVTAAKADLRLAIDRRDVGQIENAADVKAVLKLTNVTTALKAQRDAVKFINQSEMTDDEKMKQTDAIGSGMVATAKAGLAVLDEIEARAPENFEGLTPIAP